MRSEREIREFMAEFDEIKRKRKTDVLVERKLSNGDPIYMGYNDEYCSWLDDGYHMLEWVIEGEPRYSVKELEKIWDEDNPEAFMKNLKNKEKVKEILDGNPDKLD